MLFCPPARKSGSSVTKSQRNSASYFVPCIVGAHIIKEPIHETGTNQKHGAQCRLWLPQQTDPDDLPLPDPRPVYPAQGVCDLLLSTLGKVQAVVLQSETSEMSAYTQRLTELLDKQGAKVKVIPINASPYNIADALRPLLYNQISVCIHYNNSYPSEVTLCYLLALSSINAALSLLV